jgi:hypothetical protein
MNGKLFVAIVAIVGAAVIPASWRAAHGWANYPSALQEFRFKSLVGACFAQGWRVLSAPPRPSDVCAIMNSEASNNPSYQRLAIEEKSRLDRETLERNRQLNSYSGAGAQ